MAFELPNKADAILQKLQSVHQHILIVAFQWIRIHDHNITTLERIIRAFFRLFGRLFHLQWLIRLDK